MLMIILLHHYMLHPISYLYIYIYITTGFQDFEKLIPLYHRLVTRRYGKPQRGERDSIA